jgi:DNA-binding NtrC family response regulator
MTDSIRILVGTGTVENRASVEELLDRSGRDLRAHYVEELNLAIAALSGGDYDCALFDTQLQNEENPDILAELKNGDIRTPVILLTHESDDFSDVDTLVNHGRGCSEFRVTGIV